MLKKAKSQTKNVKISVKCIMKCQTEAYRIESFLKIDGFKPLSTIDKARSKKLGFIGIQS